MTTRFLAEILQYESGRIIAAVNDRRSFDDEAQRDEFVRTFNEANGHPNGPFDIAPTETYLLARAVGSRTLVTCAQQRAERNKQ